MAFFSPRKRGIVIFASSFLGLCFILGTATIARVHNDRSPWRVTNGWGICGGYGTRYLKEIPTDIYPAIYDFLHIPHNSIGAITAFDEVTAVNPKTESQVPHICTNKLNNFDGTDSTFFGVAISPLTFKTERAKALAKARKHYSGVIPPGATKAIQILISKYVPWPDYSGHDPYVFHLQVDANYSLSQIHDLVIGFYPRSGWKVVFEYSRSDAPFQGYPPTGS